MTEPRTVAVQSSSQVTAACSAPVVAAAADGLASSVTAGASLQSAEGPAAGSIRKTSSLTRSVT